MALLAAKALQWRRIPQPAFNLLAAAEHQAPVVLPAVLAQRMATAVEVAALAVQPLPVLAALGPSPAVAAVAVVPA